MTWSPQSPVRTSHANKSLSFELSPSISTAIGAPIVATGLTESPEYHGLLHSPHDHDMLEKIKAKKLVAEAMRGNTKLRQAVSELSQISATEALGKASKKQRLSSVALRIVVRHLAEPDLRAVPAESKRRIPHSPGNGCRNQNRPTLEVPQLGRDELIPREMIPQRIMTPTRSPQ